MEEPDHLIKIDELAEKAGVSRSAMIRRLTDTALHHTDDIYLGPPRIRIGERDPRNFNRDPNGRYVSRG